MNSTQVSASDYIYYCEDQKLYLRHGNKNSKYSKHLLKKAIIDKLFNNRVNTKAKKSKPNELFPNFEDLLNIDLSFFKKSAEDKIESVFIMKKDDTEVALF